MRRLPISPDLTGFWRGLRRGMASSTEVFEPRMIEMYTVTEGLRSDREAIRSDVEKAEKRLRRRLNAAKAGFARAG